MTRAKDISKIVSDANFGGTLDVGGAFTSLGIDDNANATAITIDSSENVMVSVTSASGFQSSNTESGTIAYNVGGIASNSATNDVAGVFNRLGNDGIILQLKKSGTTVGAIGVLSNRLYAGTDDTGLFFSNTTNGIHPWNTTSNSARDAGIDLGSDSRRFKDLYLSGGAFLGGTGTANKLDDYEEGTWTPSFYDLSNTPTYHNLTGKYTKIGRQCTVQYFVQTNQAPTFNTTSGATNFLVTGLPFTVLGSGYTGSQGSVMAQSLFYHGANNTQGVVGSASTGGCYLTAAVNTDEHMYFHVTNSGGIRGIVNVVGAAQGFIIEATVTYFTSD
jgi:hypothetical protein